MIRRSANRPYTRWAALTRTTATIRACAAQASTGRDGAAPTASHADGAVLVAVRGWPCGCMVGRALALVAASVRRGSNSWPACARRPSAVRALTQVQGARYVDFHAATALITRDRPRESDVRSRA